jgi:subtilase family serine protease
MSYAWNENEQCSNATEGITFTGNCSHFHIPNSEVYVARTNSEFMKLGMIGHTILAASGDDGVAGNHGSMDNCESQASLFPAASPYLSYL